MPTLHVVDPHLSVKNLPEFVARRRAEQASWTTAIWLGVQRSAGHLGFEYLTMASGIFVLHVPYRGTVCRC